MKPPSTSLDEYQTPEIYDAEYGAMKQLKRLTTLVFISFALCASACKPPAIEPIASFREANFTSIQPGDLVVFDVDDTLIQPVDTYFINEHTPTGRAFKAQLFQEHPEVKNWDELATIVLQEAKRPLLEPMVLEKIQNLKSCNIAVIACTGMNTGPHGTLPSLEEWRYTHLKSLGFQGDYANLVFPLKGFKRHPGFYRGVLSTDLEPKGPVIGAFLDEVQLHPHKIIMFDDTLDFLHSVQEECAKRDIPFQGYLYERGLHEKPWNKALAHFQAEYLIKHKKWLSDEEATHKMNQKRKTHDY